MTIGDWAARLRYRYVPDHVVGEVLGRRWMDNVIPVALLIALTTYLIATIPNFTSFGNLSDTSRQIGEFGLVVIGMTIVMLGGGIDLSVGSSFALANLTALALINVAKWPLAAAIAATVGVGALVGLVNGFLIGFLRLRAFLTTLVMMTLIRAIFELLLQLYSVRIASSDVEIRRLGFCRLGIHSWRAHQLRGSGCRGDRRACRSLPASHRLAHHWRSVDHVVRLITQAFLCGPPSA